MAVIFLSNMYSVFFLCYCSTFLPKSSSVVYLFHGFIISQSTSNYLARRFGVRAAMPGFIGRKLCPDLVIVPTHFDKYTAVSKQIRAVMADYDPNFCPMSLDEAYLDMTEHLQKRATFGDEERTFQVMLDPEVICKCDKKTREAVTKDNICVPNGSSTGTGLEPEVENVEKKCTDLTQSKAKDVCTLCGRPLDISHGKVETFGVCAEEAVREMRARIHWETKLTASAGKHSFYYLFIWSFHRDTN